MVTGSGSAQASVGSTTLAFEGPFVRWPRVADAVLAAVVFGLAVFVVEGANPDDLAIRPLDEVPIAAFVLFTVACGALLWRRSRPLPVFAVTLVTASLSGILGYSDLVGFSFIISVYGAGRYVTDDRWSYASLGVALLFALSTWFLDEPSLAAVGFGLIVMSGTWYAGRRMRFRGERAAQLERERRAEARRMVAEERTRIARELHDVVAHRVSLMTVQAGAAKTVAASDLDSAVQAMEAVERAGREALDELRHLLAVLRPDADADTLGPQPGLGDIPELVRQFADAGLEVRLAVDGTPTDLPARVDLFGYRIVQEALTNVLKHAGPDAQAEVRLGVDAGSLVVDVQDSGRGATILPGSGHGIIGMRERARLLGGTLEAGPHPGGGFHVLARLPVDGVTP